MENRLKYQSDLTKKELYQLAKKYPVNELLSYGILFLELIVSTIAIWLSFSSIWFIWLIGQIILGFVMLQWFFIMHDLAHRSMIHHRQMSAFFGHLASLFCLIPYHSWKKVHHEHHKWTGWQENDPTVPDFGIEDLSPFLIRVIDFCWKYWIPVFAVSYTLSIFYNIKKLYSLYPNEKIAITSSILFIAVCYAALIWFIGLAIFIKIFALAFLIFLFISDPLLLSQHAHLDGIEHDTQSIRPIQFIHQDLYSRTVEYPKWIEKYIFLNFPKHGAHHQFPFVPMYHLDKLPKTSQNVIDWKDWLRIAKKVPGHILIFQSFKDTGIQI